MLLGECRRVLRGACRGLEALRSEVGPQLRLTPGPPALRATHLLLHDNGGCCTTTWTPCIIIIARAKTCRLSRHEILRPHTQLQKAVRPFFPTFCGAVLKNACANTAVVPENFVILFSNTLAQTLQRLYLLYHRISRHHTLYFLSFFRYHR